MNLLKIRDLVLGEGIPKICVPIVGTTWEEIKEQAEEIVKLPVDLVEWRMDWYEKVTEESSVINILGSLRELLGDLPLLATFRTKQEGGMQEFSEQEYCALMNTVLTSGYVDLADVELFLGEELVKELIEVAHRAGVFVIASNHDFSKTPTKGEMIQRLCKMQDLGADVLKIAVMPNTNRDVLTLLETTVEMNEIYAKKPLITMAMSRMGVISRLSGECFGSAVTFGAAQKASAPGQIGAEELSEILQVLHGKEE